jgi:hypothetical protein
LLVGLTVSALLLVIVVVVAVVDVAVAVGVALLSLFVFLVLKVDALPGFVIVPIFFNVLLPPCKVLVIVTVVVLAVSINLFCTVAIFFVGRFYIRKVKEEKKDMNNYFCANCSKWHFACLLGF